VRRVLIILLACLAATVARAQEILDFSGEPAPGTAARTIFVIGDSLAGGLGAGMKRLTEGGSDFQVQLRFQEDSGVSRPEVYDWPDAIGKIARSNRVDIAVVLIGTNDVRAIRDGEVMREFGSPEWAQAYGREVDQMIASLKQTGAAVYWVSLPPMANGDYDSAIAQIAGVQRSRAEAAGIVYVDIQKDLLNADGTFMVRGPDDTGAVRKLRDSDGVHFMKVGNNKIGRLVLTAIEKPAEEPKVPQTAVEEGKGDSMLAGTGPIFGQMESPDTVSIFRPASLTSLTGEPLPINAADLSLVEGSSAYKLFVEGESPPPQAGRFDDFSYSETSR
jgi:hypothetical protein